MTSKCLPSGFEEALRVTYLIIALNGAGTRTPTMVQSAMLMFAILTWLVLRWARQDTERQGLIDLAIERGIDLD